MPSNLLITANQLQALLHTDNCLVFDVRHDLADHEAGRRQYVQGHIPNAVYLDHEQQLSAPRTGRNGRHPLPELSDFKALMNAAGVKPDTHVVVYDASGGMFAAHLWWMLRWAGYERVQVLDGGWQVWVSAGGTIQEGSAGKPLSERDAAAAKKTAPMPAMPVVNAEAVLKNLTSNAFVVLDARAPERYRGEVEPMDPVAGHIPGALNRPHSLNLQPDGRFKTPQQLGREFTELLDGRAAKQVVHQCGSGITASHNLFAMELAGLSGSALYAGSWSEWCSDPTRPVAKH